MKFLSFEDYVDFYKKFNRFPDGSYVSPKGYNERQIKTKYETYEKKYLKKQNSQKVQKNKLKSIKRSRLLKKDSQWEDLKLLIDERDHKECQYYKLLSESEKLLVKPLLTGYGSRIERAHVFGRKAFPHMKYMLENVFSLYGLFHSRLDKYLHPITGKSLSKEEHDMIWQQIIGEDNYLKLKKVANKNDN